MLIGIVLVWFRSVVLAGFDATTISGSFLAVDLHKDAEELLPTNKKGEKPNLYRLGRIVRQARSRESGRWFKAMDVLHEAHNRLFMGGAERTEVLEAAVLELCLA